MGRHDQSRVRDWLADAGVEVRLLFCRFTQLGLLRLLSAETVMGDEVMNQKDTWATYDRWLEDARVEFLDEPPGLERRFRSMMRLRHPAPKDWADSYLAAFAGVAQLTLVTFDRAMRGKVKPIVLLGDER
jgi:uncharacterized protein